MITTKKKKKKEKKRNWILPSQRTKKAVEHENDSDTNCGWCTWNGPQRQKRGLKELEIEGRIETIQAIELLRSARILRRVLET